MTGSNFDVIPAQVGIPWKRASDWIPACAGMTDLFAQIEKVIRPGVWPEVIVPPYPNGLGYTMFAFALRGEPKRLLS
jgi:hypothetical protein